jgi:membrane-bound acyltransferase YfiQ involved in biofilm formation
MAGVVVTHAIIATQPVNSAGANGVLVVLHTNRELFFFVSAFVLALSTRFWERNIIVGRFWRRRFPPVLFPYLLWNFIYWGTDLLRFAPDPGLALSWIVGDLAHGWSHLYFLLVTMQLYVLMPVLTWLVMKTRGYHWWLLGVSAVLAGAGYWILQYDWPYYPYPIQWYLFGNAQVLFISYQFFFILGALCAYHFNDVRAWLLAHRPIVLGAALAGGVAGVGWYLLNMFWLGQPSSQASNVLQPGEMLLVVAALIGLWMLGEWAVASYPAGGRLWRAIDFSTDASFGVFLFHMLPIIAVVNTPLWIWLGFDLLPSPVATVVMIVIALGLTLPCVWVLRRLPLSAWTTGRPRKPGGALPRVLPADRPA